MADVDRLLREYIERFESGGSVDPGDMLSQVKGEDRARLQALIEGYLEHAAPQREWDAEAFRGSLAERAVARATKSWTEAGELSSELVRLRNERQVTREQLVGQLADSLGVPDRREKVAWYYHRLEHGLLPAQGISSKVWESLASFLHTSADFLRGLAPSTGASGPTTHELWAAHARTAPPPPPEYAHDEPADRTGMPSPAEPAAEEPDEVDQLFTGG